MRADTLRVLLPGADWDLVDTDEEFQCANRLARTITFRFRLGPVVNRINRKIAELTAATQYDLVWVDKGVYLWPDTVGSLRKSTSQMVHFTPDTAFLANRSRHFLKSARQYDLLVTTKSFELDNYLGITDSERVILTTQAFDSSLHRPPPEPVKKSAAAVFIGLCEPDREKCIETLLAAGVTVRVGGQRWGHFARRHVANPNFQFIGTEVFGAQYVSEYASASVGLGLLSKKFPELHTTRTFEIPACKTVLATERNEDATRFFAEDEALFFNDYHDLARRVSELLSQPEKIAAISAKGYQRVLADGRDYSSVLSAVLQRLSLH